MRGIQGFLNRGIGRSREKVVMLCQFGAVGTEIERFCAALPMTSD